MTMPVDPYSVLGVKRTASPQEIRSAYRQLAKKYHPDLNPGDQKAEDHFKVVSMAHELLSDPDKRRRFDAGEIDAAGQERAPQPFYRDYASTDAGRRYSHSRTTTDRWSTNDLNDLFASTFEEELASHELRPRPGRDGHYHLLATFLDAVNGTTKRLVLPNGRALDVKIPPGTADGQVLRLNGQGEAGFQGGPPGDAFIAIRVSPHPHYTRHGQDIRLEVPITLSEAVLGDSIEVPTPTGPVRLRIPPRSDSGTELRLKGRGVPAHGQLPAGNLYVRLRVVLGQSDKALEDFLRQWKPEHPNDPRADMRTPS